jgi:hypothetical protein
MKFVSIASLLFFSSTNFVANGFVSPFNGKPRTSTSFIDIYAAADTAVTTDMSTTTEAGTANDMGAAAISALTKNVKTVFSLEDISKILPHRYPFLLVDKVVEYEAGKVCTLLFRFISYLLFCDVEVGFLPDLHFCLTTKLFVTIHCIVLPLSIMYREL